MCVDDLSYVAVFAAAAAVAASLFVFTRWRARARRGLLRYPILLAHGVLGFDQVNVAGRNEAYFRGIKKALTELGAEVYTLKVPKLAPVEERAAVLAEGICALPCRRVHIIAHSMGGLDARFAVANLGIARRVASVVTVGTPHRGTVVADVGTGVLGTLGLSAVLGKVGLDLAALKSLRTDALVTFNRNVPNMRGVRYACVLSATSATEVHPALLPTYLLQTERAGANDGMVSVASQRWGEVIAEVRLDHWGQIGWSRQASPVEMYVTIMRALARGGG